MQKTMKTNNDTNYIQTIFNILLLIILLISISFDIYHFVNLPHNNQKVSEIELRLLALEKLIYDVKELE